jgi:hypothetical protein
MILEAEASVFANDWAPVQADIARTNRVCVSTFAGAPRRRSDSREKGQFLASVLQADRRLVS